ncbi:hypothetical protein PAMP_020827 [Pampus punctatissimus]
MSGLNESPAVMCSTWIRHYPSSDCQSVRSHIKTSVKLSQRKRNQDLSVSRRKGICCDKDDGMMDNNTHDTKLRLQYILLTKGAVITELQNQLQFSRVVL